MKIEVTLKQLLEAGVHFGHQTNRWNPKMAKFIFGSRNGIYIVDLEKTIKHLSVACQFLESVVSEGREVLFVATKHQAKESIQAAAASCRMPYVTERWLGGTLTNFHTIRKSVTRLEAIEKMEEEGTFKFFTKKEVNSIQQEREKLTRNLTGIRKLKRLPGALFVIDPGKEQIAVREALKLDIPVIALVDTNSDPDVLTYPIPGNDDAIRSIKLISQTVSQAILNSLHAYETAQQRVSSEEEETGEDTTTVSTADEEDTLPLIADPAIAVLEEKLLPINPRKISRSSPAVEK